MDTPKHTQPPVMRPIHFGEHSSHLTHRPAVTPKGRGGGWGLMARLGIGGAKVL